MNLEQQYCSRQMATEPQENALIILIGNRTMTINLNIIYFLVLTIFII